MTLRYDQLPAKIRAQVDKIAGAGVGPSRENGSTAGRGVSAAPARANHERYRCKRCGHTETAWAAAQRHADTHGGATVELILTGAQ